MVLKQGPIPPNDDFVSTQKGKTVYTHLLNSEIDIIRTGKIAGQIKGVYDLKTKTKLAYRNDDFGLIIDLSSLPKDPIDTIIKIELK